MNIYRQKELLMKHYMWQVPSKNSSILHQLAQQQILTNNADVRYKETHIAMPVQLHNFINIIIRWFHEI